MFNAGLESLWFSYGSWLLLSLNIVKNSNKLKLIIKLEVPLTLPLSSKDYQTLWLKHNLQINLKSIKKKYKRWIMFLPTKKSNLTLKNSIKENLSTSVHLNSKIKSFKNFNNKTKKWSSSLLDGFLKDKTAILSVKRNNKWLNSTKNMRLISKLKRKELFRFLKNWNKKWMNNLNKIQCIL